MVSINNSINNTIGASNSGVTNTLTVTNPSNTASSQAEILVTVGGGTAGDAFTNYTVSGVTNWSEGIDNSDSDKWKLSASATLGTTDIIAIDPGANGNAVVTTQGTGQTVIGTGSPTVQSGSDRIPISVCQSVAAGTLAQEIFNTDNTSTSSRANLNVRVGGSSAGDAVTSWLVNGVTIWTSGIDNSVSGDPWVLASNASLGVGSDVLSITTAGAGTFPVTLSVGGSLGVADTFTVTSSNAGDSQSSVRNSNSATGAVRHYLLSDTTSTGDLRYCTYTQGTATWSWGNDTSASNAWKLSQDAELGNNDTIVVTTAGEITKPRQPAFMAYKSSNSANATGDGTNVTVVFDTEVFDQNADYNNGTGVFTAPVTGRYQFNVVVDFSNTVTATSVCFIQLVATGTTYFLCYDITAGTTILLSGSMLISMTAGDTVSVNAQASGATKTVGIAGQATPLVTQFSGSLIC